MTRKICVVTGTRADYGLLYWLLREVEQDSDLQLQLVVTGMHLSPEFGETYKVIENDGFHIDEKIEILLSSNTSLGMAKSVGLGVIAFAETLTRIQPDVIVLLGDRFEILAAAEAALMCRIPIAHIHGGELSEGVVDDAIRHSITKMALYHFVAADAYRQRVIQLGEAPSRVFNVGAPGLDTIEHLQFLDKRSLEQQLHFDLGQKFFLVTYHPVTLLREEPELAVEYLLQALGTFPDAQVLLTLSNADAGGRAVNRMFTEYATAHPTRVHVASSLGQQRYLSALKLASAVIGNSSSGIIEAPFLGTPTVNIGGRQAGRLRAPSIIDCNVGVDEMVQAFQLALSDDFQAMAANRVSLYGNGGASRLIKEYLKSLELTVVAKTFYDLPGLSERSELDA